MTAFARAEAEFEGSRLTWELRSVNHRFLEMALRLPEEQRSLDPLVRESIQGVCRRGRVDLSLRVQPAAGAAPSLRLNRDLAAGLAGLLGELRATVPDLAQPSALEMLSWPGMVAEASPDPEALKAALMAALEAALADLDATRLREGARLQALIEERLAGVENHVAAVRARLPSVRLALRERLQQRLAEVGQGADPGRLEQELVLQLSRLDVDEELDRLGSHVAEARAALSRDEAAGRRLDFLMQEFNREANTLAAKATDPDTTRDAVELKVLIEQMREQVQNIE